MSVRGAESMSCASNDTPVLDRRGFFSRVLGGGVAAVAAGPGIAESVGSWWRTTLLRWSYRFSPPKALVTPGVLSGIKARSLVWSYPYPAYSAERYEQEFGRMKSVYSSYFNPDAIPDDPAPGFGTFVATASMSGVQEVGL